MSIETSLVLVGLFTFFLKVGGFLTFILLILGEQMLLILIVLFEVGVRHVNLLKDYTAINGVYLYKLALAGTIV